MSSNRVALAADHAGYPLKESIKAYLQEKGVECIDASPVFVEADDYPPIIRKGCGIVLRENIPGLIFGGSGNGEAMAANKMKGIRAAVCWTEEIARLARAHNNANVMSMGGRFIDGALAKKMVDVFLETAFERGRHERRVKDLEEIEN